MKVEIINEELYKFINEHKDNDPASLLFSMHNRYLPFSLSFAVTQIEARKKTALKIPKFISNKLFLFPDALAAEQATDERVAGFHSELAGTGNNILDLTGGLGIDSMTLAAAGNNLTVCEINPIKAQILLHNSNILNISSFKVFNIDCREFLKNNKDSFDIVYIDPARRDSANRRTYSLVDCEPDVISLFPDIFDITPIIMIKVSPLLDIDKLIKDVPHLERIYAVCVKNECKELLLKLNKDSEFLGYQVVDIDDNGKRSEIDFPIDILHDERDLIIDDSEIADGGLIGKYLYEPNAGIMKLPRKSAIASKFEGMKQLSPNTPLFLSSSHYPDFPGRVLQITDFPSKSELKKMKDGKYNVVCRNYPLGADELRKKLKVKEGKDDFIYAFRIGKKEKPVICTAIRL